jgi:hypothetical protein
LPEHDLDPIIQGRKRGWPREGDVPTIAVCQRSAETGWDVSTVLPQMRVCYLEPVLPIPRAPFLVSDRDDLQVRCEAINQRVRVSVREDVAPATIPMLWPAFRCLCHGIDGFL